MDAAALVQLAQARGIDLKYVAGVASKTDGVARKRQRTELEIELGMHVRETVTGRQSRTYRQPTWTVAELGQAARGLSPVPWAAALYSFAGSRDGYWILWHALANEAHRLARRENWPPRVVYEDGERRFYREELAEFVLTWDAHRHFFVAAPQLYAICLKVTPAVWEQQLRDPFRSLQGSYERWLSIARAAIGRWINEPA
jgi:hypothetical protein